MPSPKKSAPARSPSFADLISVVSTPERWRIYTELAKGEPLPAGEIARRVGLTPNGASKLLLRLQRSGLLERRYGRVYRIPPQFLVSGEAKLDFGAFFVRLDYQHKESA
jgi:DNA-binding transcriptional ArsR family regulator